MNWRSWSSAPDGSIERFRSVSEFHAGAHAASQCASRSSTGSASPTPACTGTESRCLRIRTVLEDSAGRYGHSRTHDRPRGLVRRVLHASPRRHLHVPRALQRDLPDQPRPPWRAAGGRPTCVQAGRRTTCCARRRRTIERAEGERQGRAGHDADDAGMLVKPSSPHPHRPELDRRVQPPARRLDVTWRALAKDGRELPHADQVVSRSYAPQARGKRSTTSSRPRHQACSGSLPRSDKGSGRRGVDQRSRKRRLRRLRALRDSRADEVRRPGEPRRNSPR